MGYGYEGFNCIDHSYPWFKVTRNEENLRYHTQNGAHPKRNLGRTPDHVAIFANHSRNYAKDCKELFPSI